jgi:PAS domain S-box-containing protein
MISSLYPPFAVLGGLLTLVFVRPALRNRDKPGATGLLVLIAAAVVYALALGVRATGLPPRQLFVVQNVVILGASLGSIGWFLIFVEYAGLVSSMRQTLGLLFGFVLLVQLTVWTNPIHLLFWDPISQLTGDTSTNRRVLYAAFTLAAYGLVLIGAIAISRDILRSTGVRRRQGLYVLASFVPPAVFIIVSGTGSRAPVDLTPVGFVVATGILSWALFRADVLEIVTVGRSRAIEDIRDPFVTVDADDRVIDSNPAARETFAVGSDWEKIDMEAFFGPHAERIRELRDGASTETPLTLRREGTECHLALQTAPVHGPQRKQRGQLLVFRDVSELKRREQTLEQQNELFNEFASVVSHDVATPLGVIENKAQLIELTGDTDHVDDIHAASEQVRELIDRLRALAAAGSDIGDTGTVDLATVARDAWVTVPSHDATLSIDAEIAVEADRNRLRQALENLFENAVEHGSTSPLAPGDSGQPQSDDAPAVSTTVGTFEEGFYVADDGPGIPAPDREAIFEQGYSTDSEGTGIGLSIVRRIVEAHGWRIEVTDSDAGGARFEFWTDE